MASKAGPIARFALASTLAHGGVLVALHSPAPPGPIPPDAGQLAVHLAIADAAPAPRPENQPRPARRKPAARAADPPPENRALPVPARADARIPDAPVDDVPQAEPVAEATTEAVAPAPRPHAWIRARLEADLARHFDYPYLARLHGWEGTVWLAFRLEADGRLEAVRLARSSGFAALDTAALHSLERVERLPQAVAWLQGYPLDMELPVIYRLVGVR